MIIVVDDDVQWGAFIARELRQACGGESDIRIAESGDEALAIIADNPDKAIRAVITNFHMGDGMNGAQLAERIMQCAPEPKPLIILRTRKITPEVVHDYFRVIRQKKGEDVREFANAVGTMLR